MSLAYNEGLGNFINFINEGVLILMVKVKARTNESVDQMLRRFKKLCEKEGIVKEVKRLMYFEKPSEQKRRKIRKAERKLVRDRMLGIKSN